MASIPPGQWMSYQDLAIAAGGSAGAGMALGQGLMRRDEMVDGVRRVLDRHGRINEKWQGKHPRLPADAAGVRRLLEEEGLSFEPSIAPTPAAGPSRNNARGGIPVNGDDDEPRRWPISDDLLTVDLDGACVVVKDGTEAGLNSNYDLGVLPEAAIRTLRIADLGAYSRRRAGEAGHRGRLMHSS